MKNSHTKKGSFGLWITLIVVTVVGGVCLWQIGAFNTVETTPVVPEVVSDYTFKTSMQKVPGNTSKDSQVFVEIYKKGELERVVLANKSAAGADMFTLSPDGNSVLFRVNTVGGTCVAVQYPAVIDLKTFSLVKTNRSATNVSAGNHSSVEAIQSMKWLSNSSFETAVKYGDATGKCGNSLETTLTYALVK